MMSDDMEQGEQGSPMASMQQQPRPSQAAMQQSARPSTASVPQYQTYGSQQGAPPAGYSIRTSVAGGAAAAAPKGVDDGTASTRYKVIVLGIIIVICLGVAAIVLPFTLDSYCDCPDVPNISSPTQPTPSPAAPSPPSSEESPTADPSSQSNVPTTGRFTQFVDGFAADISGRDVFEDPTSPQYRAAEFIANEVSFDSEVTNVEQLGDLYAVTVFYYSTGGDDWTECSQGSTDCEGQSWLSPTVGYCEWFWITCNPDGRVSDIVFTSPDGNNLDGPLTLELGLLTELSQFIAYNNTITGNIPKEFGQLTNVTRVILAANSMSGVLPSTLFNNAPLEVFMVSGNGFSGAIPESFTAIPTLSQVLLGNNRFSGTIPEGFGDLPSLGTLDLTGNRFIGVIPDSVYSSSIENLFLGGNQQLRGTISSAIGQASSLVRLRITGTTISGGIPDEIFTLPALEEIDLSNNDFTGGLSDLVSELGATLSILKLDGNRFSGTLPSLAINDLTVSNILKFDRNNFTGVIFPGTCERIGDGRTDLQELTVDCAEVSCTCCTNCPQ